MMINEKTAKQSRIRMRTRRPLDLEIEEMMKNISDNLRRLDVAVPCDSTLRQVAHRHIQLGGRR